MEIKSQAREGQASLAHIPSAWKRRYPAAFLVNTKTWQQIMEYLPTLLDAHNLMKAVGDRATEALDYNNREEMVVAQILRRQIRLPELYELVQAMAYFRGAENSYFDFARYATFKRYIMPTTKEFFTRKSIPPSLKLAEAFKQVCITDTAQRLAEGFQANLMVYLVENGNDNSFAEIAGKRAEGREIIRIGVAMYLVGTYFKHFNLGIEQMTEDQVETHAKRFFYHMPPWEKEMMMTVMEGVTEMVISNVIATADATDGGKEWLTWRMETVAKHPLMTRLINQKINDWKRTGEWDKSPRQNRILISRVHIRVVAWKAYPLIYRILKTTKPTTRRRRWDDLFNQGPKWGILFEHFAAVHEVFPPPRALRPGTGESSRAATEHPEGIALGPESPGVMDGDAISIASSSCSPSSLRTPEESAKLRRRATLFAKIHEKYNTMPQAERRLWNIRQKLDAPEWNEFFRVDYSTDPDDGPAKSWQRAHYRVRSPRWVANPKMFELRRCGYVFWDQERFRGNKNVWVRQPAPIEDNEEEVMGDESVADIMQSIDAATPTPAPQATQPTSTPNENVAPTIEDAPPQFEPILRAPASPPISFATPTFVRRRSPSVQLSAPARRRSPSVQLSTPEVHYAPPFSSSSIRHSAATIYGFRSVKSGSTAANAVVLDDIPAFSTPNSTKRRANGTARRSTATPTRNAGAARHEIVEISDSDDIEVVSVRKVKKSRH